MEHNTEAAAMAALVAKPGHGYYETNNAGEPVRPFWLGQDMAGKPLVLDLTGHHRTKPWKEGWARHTTLDSFRRYLKEQGSPDTAVFAVSGLGHLKLRAILDFHSPDGDPGAGGLHHEADFDTRLTTPFVELRAAIGREMGQADFLELIEDVGSIIAEPQAAELLEMLSDLESRETTTYRSVIHKGGGIKISGEDETQVTNQTLPAQLVFRGKPFINTGENNPVLTLTARLRVRLSSKKLTFQLIVEQEPEAWALVAETMLKREAWPRQFDGSYEG